MNKTSIGWTDWSCTPLKMQMPDGALINACAKVSTGCASCYAESYVRRFWKKAWGKFPGYTRALLRIGKPVLVEKELQAVLHLSKRIKAGKANPEVNKIFWNDMTDEYLSFWPDALRDKLYDVRWMTPNLIHQVLTKRPEAMLKYVKERAYRQCHGWTDKGRMPITPGEHIHFEDLVGRNQCGYVGNGDWRCLHPKNENGNGNDSCHSYSCPIAYEVHDRETLIQIGVDKDYEFDGEGLTDDCEWMQIHGRPKHAMPENMWFGFSAENQEMFTKRMRAFRPMRWVSAYITLFVSLEPLLGPISTKIKYWEENEGDEPNWDALEKHDFSDGGGPLFVPYLNWGIGGCESGSRRREWKQEWDLSLEQQFSAAGVAFFRKQIVLDGRVSTNPSEWEPALRCQQFPAPQASGV